MLFDVCDSTGSGARRCRCHRSRDGSIKLVVTNVKEKTIVCSDHLKGDDYAQRHKMKDLRPTTVKLTRFVTAVTFAGA